MSRLAVFWGLVAAVMLAGGAVRFQARQSYVQAVQHPIFLARVAAVLAEAEVGNVEELTSGRINKTHIGYRFDHPTCKGKVHLVESRMNFVMASHLRGRVPSTDALTLVYYGRKVPLQARMSRTLIWAKHRFGGVLVETGTYATRSTLAVAMPQGCDLPKLKWARIWQCPTEGTPPKACQR